MRRLVPSPVILTVLLAGLAMLASCRTAQAGFVPVNSDELGSANINPDDGRGMAPSSAAADQPQKEDPLSPSNERNGPQLGRDLLSLLGLGSGRGNQARGTGNSGSGHDSGGIGQALVVSISTLVNTSFNSGDTIIDPGASFSEAVSSRLFRPPRIG